MLLNLGRLFMLLVWGCLLWNLIAPLPKPLNYFLYVALAFMALMHFFKVLLLSKTQPKDNPFTTGFKIRLFFFGVVELWPLYQAQKAALVKSQNASSTQKS